MAQSHRTTAAKGRIALIVVIAIAVIVAVLFVLQGVNTSEPENVYGTTQPGVDLGADPQAAPPEGAEGAAGIVNRPPNGQAAQGGETDAAN